MRQRSRQLKCQCRVKRMQGSNHYLQDYLQDDEQNLHQNTQQPFKMQMRGLFQDIKKLMEKGVHSYSYTRHSASIWPTGAAQHQCQACSVITLVCISINPSYHDHPRFHHSTLPIATVRANMNKIISLYCLATMCLFYLLF
jgi:hypothetical protein